MVVVMVFLLVLLLLLLTIAGGQVIDPCGMAGGTLPGMGHGGDAVFTTTRYAKFGDLGSEVLPYAPSGTKWSAGELVEVGWAIRYNHGGGYQYRLCPKPKKGELLTEACFQVHKGISALLLIP